MTRLRILTARLPRRVVFWVFISVIAIETIIFIPSLRNRERELLDQVRMLSSAKADILLRTTPQGISLQHMLAVAANVLLDEPIVGLAVLRADGRLIGTAGEKPHLSAPGAGAPGTQTWLDRSDNRYEITVTGLGPERNGILILRHDIASVRRALYGFFGRIAGLVVIISMVVTAGTLIALGPLVLRPILRLREDLLAAGEAVRRDLPAPQFASSRFKQADELGDVILAFERMFAQITQAIAHRKQAENTLKDTLRQLEAYSLALKQELDKGREIQKNFLPLPLPQEAGWELAAYFKPARQVAGDYYDVFQLPGGQLGIVVADVCDKGVGAALFMALFRSLIRIFSGQYDVNAGACPGGRLASETPLLDPAQPAPGVAEREALQAVAHTNDYVARNHEDLGMFATLVFGVLDPGSGRLAYINAGHEPLFVLAPSGGVRVRLAHTGPAVGLAPGAVFKIAQAQLAPGETLFGFTDGVPEATTPAGDFFGLARLVALLSQPRASAAALLEAIAAEVKAHTGEADQFDDITMLAVRRAGMPPGRQSSEAAGAEDGKNQPDAQDGGD